MNDEYLWQKTGEDPEIAKLEKTLAVFRYRDTAPPALTLQIVAKPRRWRLVAAFASFAVVAIAAIVWSQIGRVDTGDEIVFVNETTAPPAVAPVIESPVPSVPTTIDNAPPKSNQRREINRTNAALTRRPRTKSQSPEGSIAALTAEERYAYQQLMLALSISSSKLKVVQDAINGVEANETSPKQNHR